MHGLPATGEERLLFVDAVLIYRGNIRKLAAAHRHQAVDDKLTVICLGGNDEGTVLPGSAVDGDPRLPLYRTSEHLLSNTVMCADANKFL